MSRGWQAYLQPVSGGELSVKAAKAWARKHLGPQGEFEHIGTDLFWVSIPQEMADEVYDTSNGADFVAEGVKFVLPWD